MLKSNKLKANYWVNGIFIILIFLPPNTVGYSIQFFFTALILYKFKTFRSVEKLNFRLLSKCLVIISICLTFVYSLITHKIIHTDSVIKIAYFLVLISFFPIIDGYSISKKTLFYCIIFIIITQLSFVLRLSFLTDFIDQYYTVNERIYSAELNALENEVQSVFSFRFGGVFRNPNQCGRIVTLLLAVYLIFVKKIVKKDIFFIVLVVISVLLTGSRTALAITSLLLVVHFYKSFKNNKIKIIFGSIVGFIILVNFVDFDSRIFDFSELVGSNKEASVNSKSKFLSDYIDFKLENNPTDILLGTFNFADELDIDFNFTERIENFDSEIGYVLHAFGVLGIFSIIIFYVFLYNKGGYEVKLLMIILLWCISSSLLSNLRFSLLFFLIVGMHYSKRIETGCADNYN